GLRDRRDGAAADGNGPHFPCSIETGPERVLRVDENAELKIALTRRDLLRALSEVANRPNTMGGVRSPKQAIAALSEHGHVGLATRHWDRFAERVFAHRSETAVPAAPTVIRVGARIRLAPVGAVAVAIPQRSDARAGMIGEGFTGVAGIRAAGGADVTD